MILPLSLAGLSDVVSSGSNQATAALAVDLCIAIPVVINAYLGFRGGLVRRVLSFVGIYAGAIAASSAGNSLTDIVGIHTIFAREATFVVVFIGIQVLIEVLGMLYAKTVRSLVSLPFDRIAGVCAGIGTGLVQATLLLLVAFAVDTTQPGQALDPGKTVAVAIQASTLGHVIVVIEPGVTTLLAPVLPEHLGQHFEDGLAQ